MVEITLILIPLAILTIIGCGFCFRIRGGLWNDYIPPKLWGSTKARFIAWAIPVSMAIWFWSPISYPWIPALIIATWLGSILGWWHSLDMGTQDDTLARDFSFHTLRGLFWTMPIALVTGFLGLYNLSIALILAGSLCGIAYLAGYKTPTLVQLEAEGGMNTGAEIGEFYFGVIIGLAIVIGGLLS